MRILAERYRRHAAWYWCAVFAGILAVTIPNGFQKVTSSATAYAKGQIAPLLLRDMHDRIMEIASEHLEGTSCPRIALSLSPIPLLGTSFVISPYSATGPFIPRVRAELQRHAPAFAHFADIETALEQSQPTALLVGYFPHYEVEQAIQRYAQKNDFTAFDLGKLPDFEHLGKAPEMVLLVRASCMTNNAR